MSKSTYNIDPTPEPVIKPMNPEAMNYLKWFMADTSSLNTWAGQIFSSDIDLNSSRFIELKNAAEMALIEIEDDISKIKAFLDAYTCPSSNNS